MSSEIISRVMRADFQGRHQLKLLAIGLADCCGEDALGSAPFSRLCTVTELSRAAVETALNRLTSRGLIRWKNHPEKPDTCLYAFDMNHPAMEVRP